MPCPGHLHTYTLGIKIGYPPGASRDIGHFRRQARCLPGEELSAAVIEDSCRVDHPQSREPDGRRDPLGERQAELQQRPGTGQQRGEPGQAGGNHADWLLVVNGDTFLEIPLALLLEKTTDPAVDGALLVRFDPSGNYTAMHCENDLFLDVCQPGSGPGMMFAGAALFKKKAIEKLDDVNFFNSIRRQRLRFKTVFYDGIWLDNGTPESYLSANHAYRAYVSAAPANSLSENVTVSQSAQVERSVLWENTRLGDRVSLSECIVTGNIELEDVSRQRCIISRLGVFPLR